MRASNSAHGAALHSTFQLAPRPALKPTLQLAPKSRLHPDVQPAPKPLPLTASQSTLQSLPTSASEPGKTSPPSQFTQAVPRSKKVIKPNRETTVVDEEEESNFIIVQSQAPSVVTSSTNNNTKASYSSQPKASTKPSDNILPQHGLHFLVKEITDTSCRPRERYGTIHIGLFYELDQGVEKYSSRAAFRKTRLPTKVSQRLSPTLWLVKAPHQDNASAQFNLGLMYHGGEEVPASRNKAMEWLFKAAQKGHVPAREAYREPQAD